MSTTLKRIAFLVLSLAGGIWAVLESGASPPGADTQDVRPGVGAVVEVPANRAHVEVGEQAESPVAITKSVAPRDTVVAEGHFALGHNSRRRVETEGDQQ